MPLARKRKREAQPLLTAACWNTEKNPQGAVVPLPLLRKNEWAEIAERGFCEEARALVRGKGRGTTAPGGKKEKSL
ncbi:hypothetical protein [Halobacillus litoralis]|uniref:hypothetical protein n=1 Tax=Halobacillus litoralis TaxID=45668 RepID=UPI001CD3743A|nr:hypothetical protein [Halobacillus litoralis]MCA1023249.1 hypothetical protein [Halobacillus litoralis]